MSRDSLKQFQLTLLGKGIHKLGLFQTFIAGKSESEGYVKLAFQLDFVVDCQAYQKFTKKYYTEGMPQLTTDNPTVMSTKDILKNCSQIPFMKRPAKIPLERYNQDLETTKTMLIAILDNYLIPSSLKRIPLGDKVLESLVKLIDKGYAHPDILSEAYFITTTELLPFYQEFLETNKPLRSSLLTFFSEKSLPEMDHFTSMFALSDKSTNAPRRSSMVSSTSSSLSKQSSDDILDYQEAPRTQSRKNSRFDASLPVLSELGRLEEGHSTPLLSE